MKLLEELAKLEHEQWIVWSTAIWKKEDISDQRFKRWVKLWIPYEDLTEEQKEQDRKWARKVMDILAIEKEESQSEFRL